MSSRHPVSWVVVFLWVAVMASVGTEDIEHARLYTAPEPGAAGGIAGRVANPSQPIRQILAIPPARPEKVYRGTVEGSDRRSFRFAGLPMDRYDLVVIYDTAFYEGLQLMRGDSTLTSEDQSMIASIIERSEPFFDLKTVHRLAGETGRGNEARAICTFARSTTAKMYMGPVIRDGLRRTFKLVMLRQVGPGWQVTRTRDLYPIWIESRGGLRVTHEYRASLSGIRVTDGIRDLGMLNL